MYAHEDESLTSCSQIESSHVHRALTDTLSSSCNNERSPVQVSVKLSSAFASEAGLEDVNGPFTSVSDAFVKTVIVQIKAYSKNKSS